MCVDVQLLLEKEDRNARFVQGIVDTALLRIMNKRMSRDEALELVSDVRRRVLEVFPDDGHTFDLVYLSRFQRAIDEHIPD